MNEETLKSIAAQLRQPHGEEGIQTGTWMNTGNIHINNAAYHALNPDPNNHILEIGMGNGYKVNEILEKDDSIIYTGCDFSEVMIEEAKKNNQEAVSSERAKFVLADVHALPFPDNSFDKTITVNTIYFWKDETTVLNELKRVLKKNGKLIIGLRPKHQMENYPFVQYGFKMFSKTDIENLVTQNGFSVVSITENMEPDFELNGEIMKTENIIAVFRKNN